MAGWQGGRVVRVLDFESVGPGFESHSEHFMDLFLGCPEFLILRLRLYIANWFASRQLGFLKTCYVPFTIFVSFVC